MVLTQAEFDAKLAELKAVPPHGFAVYNGGFFKEWGEHPADWTDVECAYAAAELAKCKPQHILDVGSYRHFVLGLGAHYDVTCLDIRPKMKLLGEKRIALDVRDLSTINDSFDAVVSLCSLEHIGLGRYGDAYDIEGDRKAFIEIGKVLTTGGHLIFSVPITMQQAILFNAHRLYNHSKLEQFCKDGGFVVEDESIFQFTSFKKISSGEVTNVPTGWDVYCANWRKV